MNGSNLRATIVDDSLDELSGQLPMQSWSTTNVTAEQVRKLDPEKMAIFQSFTRAQVLIIDTYL